MLSANVVVFNVTFAFGCVHQIVLYQQLNAAKFQKMTRNKNYKAINQHTVARVCQFSCMMEKLTRDSFWGPAGVTGTQVRRRRRRRRNG